MAVNWYWKLKKGFFYLIDSHKRTYKCGFYGGNCLGAVIYTYQAKNEEGKKESWYNFQFFFDDLNHAKRCLGLKPNARGEQKNILEGVVKKVKLNIFFKENLKLAELLVKAGFKVELYYKEIKK